MTRGPDQPERPAPAGMTVEQGELLTAYVDGELTPAEQAAAETLLAEHGAARVYVAQLRELRDDLVLLRDPQVGVPRDLVVSTVDAWLAQSPASQPAGPIRALWARWVVPLAAAAAVAAGLILWPRGGPVQVATAQKDLPPGPPGGVMPSGGWEKGQPERELAFANPGERTTQTTSDKKVHHLGDALAMAQTRTIRITTDLDADEASALLNRELDHFAAAQRTSRDASRKADGNVALRAQGAAPGGKASSPTRRVLHLTPAEADALADQLAAKRRVFVRADGGRSRYSDRPLAVVAKARQEGARTPDQQGVPSAASTVRGVDAERAGVAANGPAEAPADAGTRRRELPPAPGAVATAEEQAPVANRLVPVTDGPLAEVRKDEGGDRSVAYGADDDLGRPGVPAAAPPPVAAAAPAAEDGQAAKRPASSTDRAPVADAHGYKGQMAGASAAGAPAAPLAPARLQEAATQPKPPSEDTAAKLESSQFATAPGQARGAGQPDPPGGAVVRGRGHPASAKSEAKAAPGQPPMAEESVAQLDRADAAPAAAPAGTLAVADRDQRDKSKAAALVPAVKPAPATAPAAEAADPSVAAAEAGEADGPAVATTEAWQREGLVTVVVELVPLEPPAASPAP